MESLRKVIAALGADLVYAVIKVPNAEDTYGQGDFEVIYDPLSKQLSIEAGSEEERGNRYSIVTRRLAAYLDKVG